jgi:hypothetical protein
VLRLKDNFSRVTRDKESLADENRQLKLLLAQHGISWQGSGGIAELTQFGNTVAYSSSGSLSGSYAPGSQGFSPPPHNPHNSPGNSSLTPPIGSMNGRSLAQQQTQQGVDYDQAGIDFVLTYRDPSKAYMSPPPQ